MKLNVSELKHVTKEIEKDIQLPFYGKAERQDGLAFYKISESADGKLHNAVITISADTIMLMQSDSIYESELDTPADNADWVLAKTGVKKFLEEL
jgi:hypothetical protein